MAGGAALRGESPAPLPGAGPFRGQTSLVPCRSSWELPSVGFVQSHGQTVLGPFPVLFPLPLNGFSKSNFEINFFDMKPHLLGYFWGD